MRLGGFAGAAALCLVLTACVQVRRPPAEPTYSVAEELFDRGVAELASSGETTYFETLSREYSASPWASRARTVLDLLEQRAARAEEEIARLHAEGVRLTAVGAGLQEERDRLAAECGAQSAELDRVRADNARLLGDLEQLKNLTIEMELKR